MCKYYIVISDALVGSFLDVLFLLLAVILSELHEKPKRKDWVTEKSTYKYSCEGYHFFDCTLSILYLFAAFFVYSLSLPKRHTCGMAAIKIHILLWAPCPPFPTALQVDIRLKCQRSSHRRCFAKKLFLKISQYSQENTCFFNKVGSLHNF